MTNVPELSTPRYQQLGVIVIDPGESAPDQGVGDGVGAQLVEVDHPETMVLLSSDVEATTTWRVV